MKKLFKYIPGVSCNKRHRSDGLVILLRWLVVVGWVVMCLMLVIYGKARPRAKLDASGEIDMHYLTHGDINLTSILLCLMFVGLLVSMSGIKLKQVRARRRTDEYMYSLYILAFTSCAGIFYYYWFL